MSRRSSLLSVFVLVFLFLIFANKVVFSADLVDIRTGHHGEHSRVVIELNQAVKYTIVTDDEDELTIVNFLSVQNVADLGDIWVYKKDPILRQVTYSETAGIFSVTIALRQSDIRVEQYEMTSPFRVVLDFRLNRESLRKTVRPSVPSSGREVLAKAAPKVVQDSTDTKAAAATLSPVPGPPDIPVSEEPEPGQSFKAGADSIAVLEEFVANVPEEVLRHTRPADKIIFKSTGYRAAKMQKRQAKVTRPADLTGTSLLWISGAAFLVFNVMLGVMYFNRPGRKKQPAPKLGRRQSTGMNRASGPNASSRIARSSRKNEDEDFMEVLKKALGPSQAESADVSSALMKNARNPSNGNARLTRDQQAARKAAAEFEEQPPQPPDFSEIVSELELPARSGEMTEAAAKEQLMGRDGAEFIRNIKRLHLN